ncbi:hypothetical protein OG607_12105 [Streptomyces sp. NBC_01537]|uniref:hypothetical protein n=1 Tax=Streptomyces sp. NBC_01537 TaxID=2903896 RepID=UPI00386D05E1
MNDPDPHDVELAADLRSIVSDYPYCDPAATLDDCAERLAGDPHGDERGGLVIILNATCWYASSGRIGSGKVLQRMTEALVAARSGLPDLDDAAACEHPHPDFGNALEHAVTVGAYLLSPGGRAAYEQDEDERFMDDTPLKVWLCPAFLGQLADEAIGQLRSGYEDLFGERETGHLDARYVRPEDGRVDFPALTRAIVQRWRSDQESAEAGLWAARRWIAGEGAADDRLGLYLAMCACVFAWHEGMPTTFFRELEAAVRTVDLTPLDAPCAHDGETHPWAAAHHAGGVDGTITALNATYAADEFDAPGGPFTLGQWTCPKQAAELAQQAISDFADWRHMRGDDGDDEDWG